MKKILFILITLISVTPFRSQAQKEGQELIDALTQELSKAKEDSNKVNLMLQLSSNLRGTDVNKAITIDKAGLKLSEKIGYDPGIAKELKSIGIGYYFLGNYAEALIYWQKAKTAFEKTGDSRGVANILSNMGAIYFNQSEYTEAVKLYLEALKIAEKEKDTLRIATVLQNMGAVHNEKADFDLALKAFTKSLRLFKAVKNDEGTGLAHLNSAEIYIKKKDFVTGINQLGEALKYLAATSYYPTALRAMGEAKLEKAGFDAGIVYLDSAYKLTLRSGDDFEHTRVVNSIAGAYEGKGDLQKALEYFEKGKSLSEAADKSDLELAVSARGLVRLYSKKGDYRRAFKNQIILQNTLDSLNNAESDKKMNRLLFNFDLEKKEGEITLLVKDKKIQEIEVEKQKGLRNAFVCGFALVLLFSVVVFRQRNKVKKEKKNVEKEKQRSDELLLNILPQEVADELKESGEAGARQFDNVTVLFTDFVGFTLVSEKLTPKELVAEIHTYFTAFDNIIERHGLEKIKTIGDAYLAICGLPHPRADHARQTVLAALDILEFIKEQEARGGKFNIRIGINSGSVVAGIVGVKKFAYDIWGDTVNTAARMEQNSVNGKINISQSTYELVKNDFNCVHRGTVNAKNKGEIDMYFVEKVHNESNANA